MAIYHTRVKMFSRSKGHSAIAAAAYRAGIRLVDNITGQHHDYRRRRGVQVTRYFAPVDAPAWTVDPQELWQRVHVREKRKDSQLAREFEIALPHELSDDQRCELAWDICRDLTNRYDFAMQASIHEPPVTDGMNWHLHALATTRRIRNDELQDKTKELDGGPSGKAEVEWIRELVGRRTNEHLAAAGFDVRIDHRSLGDQLLAALDAGDLEKATEIAAREPTKPLGKRATARLRRGMDCEIADANDDIRRRNARRYVALRQQLTDAGHLPPIGHSHERALLDRGREAGQELILGSSGSIGSIQGLGRTDDLRTPEQRRDAKEEAVKASLTEAASLWAEDFVATINLAFRATHQLLRHQAQRAAAFAHLPTFRADIRAFVQCLKRLRRDATRFARRMEAEDRASHLVSQAENELSRFDHDHPREGMWTKREWKIRRARRLQAVAHRQKTHAAALAAIDPEAQTDYMRRAKETATELENLSERLLKRYPVAADVEPASELVEQPGPAPAHVPVPRGPRL